MTPGKVPGREPFSTGGREALARPPVFRSTHWTTQMAITPQLGKKYRTASGHVYGPLIPSGMTRYSFRCAISNLTWGAHGEYQYGAQSELDLVAEVTEPEPAAATPAEPTPTPSVPETPAPDPVVAAVPEPAPESEPLKLEVGKMYVDNAESVRGPMQLRNGRDDLTGDNVCFPLCDHGNRTYTWSGQYYTHNTTCSQTLKREATPLEVAAELSRRLGEPAKEHPPVAETPAPEPPPAEPAKDSEFSANMEAWRVAMAEWRTIRKLEFIADTSARLLAAAETTLPQRFHGPSMNQEMATRAVDLALELVHALESVGVVFITPGGGDRAAR